MLDRQSRPPLAAVPATDPGHLASLADGNDNASPPGGPAPEVAIGPEADQISWPVRFYIAGVTVVAGGLIWLFARDLSGIDWPALGALTLLAIVFERVGIRIYRDTNVSVGVVALIAIAILYGAPAIVIAAPIVVLAAEAFTPSPWYRRLFNVGSYTLANVATALLFHALAGSGEDVNVWWAIVAAMASVVNYGVNVALVDTAVSLATRQSWLAVWDELDRWLFPYYLVFGLLGLALAAAHMAIGMAGILAFVAPPLMMRFAIHEYVAKTEGSVLELKQKNVELKAAYNDIMQITRQLSETYDGTLEALVLALDARDRETKGHSLRVTKYMMMMADSMGIEEGTQEWVDMQRGALLHDVGKIGVADAILHKPGPLTPDEWGFMKRHPDIGHDMLHDIPFLTGAAEIVHCHHERYDGKGYPRGLAREDVPLGARIFAIADAFDAMTSDRPYRQAMRPELARWEVIRNSGTQFDPRVVQAFLEVFDEIVIERNRSHEEDAREHEQAAA